MKLSVIVPIYNSEKYLKKCIDSLVNQTYSDIEIILVNDGSTDNSESICYQYHQNDNRVKYIRKENGGPLSALRAGISACSGDYIGFVDSDDWIEPDMYERMMEKVLKNDSEIVVVGYRTFNREKDFENTLTADGGFYDKNDINEKIIPSLINKGSLRNRSCIYLSRINKIFKKHLLLNNADYFLNDDIQLGEDNLMVISSVLDAKSLYIISGYYPYHYRIENADSLTHKYQENLWNKFISLNETVRTILIEKGYERETTQLSYEYVVHTVVSLINIRRGIKNKRTAVDMIKEILKHPEIAQGIGEVIRNESRFDKKIFLRCIAKKRIRLLYLILKLVYS